MAVTDFSHRIQPARVGRISVFAQGSVPKEPSKIARHFNAGTDWKNVESHRDG
jgi:hypothetical protein